MSPPRDPASLEEVVAGFRLSQAVYAAAALRLADHLADGPRTPAELADATGAHERSLGRLLRALAAERVLEARGDAYASTPFADRLRDEGARAMALGWRCLPEKYEAFGGLLESVRSGEAAFERRHGWRFYEYLARAPHAAEAYDAAMGSTVAGFDSVAEDHDWSGVRSVVDVGGGQGGLLAALLRRHPEMRGVLFDLPAVAAGGEALMAPFGERAEIVGGDIFEGVPAGADAYVLSTVLRCFGDEDCVRVLASCRAAMPDHARLLAVEMVPGGAWASATGFADLDAMVLYGGADRTEDEWRGLLGEAGLALEGVRPIGEPFSIVEAVIRRTRR